jgi:hypothetical protein
MYLGDVIVCVQSSIAPNEDNGDRTLPKDATFLVFLLELHRGGCRTRKIREGILS